MSRVRTLFATILPSALAGGLLFASPFGHAETGKDAALGFWPEDSDTATGSPRNAVLVAQADPRPLPPRWRGGPVPPVPPIPPPPPAPPAAIPPPPPGHGHGHGFSLKVHDGKIEVDGLAELVENQLESVAGMIDSLPDVPPDVRERVKARIRAVRGKVNARLGRLRSMDLDKLDRLGPEMERMGDEIEKEMEGLDKDLAQLGDKLGKGFAKKFGKDFARSLGPSIASGRDSDGSDGSDDDDGDDDDKDAVAMPPGADTDPDPSSLGPAIADLKDLALDPAQKAQLARLRADSDIQVASAKRELERLSNELHDALRDGTADEAELAHQIDSISQKEATIRKARILAWVKARNLLREDQRKRIEAAARKTH
ncbi:MAG TPA: hypothetical protein VF469_08155 [Kofleriaceae bacterium]